MLSNVVMYIPSLHSCDVTKQALPNYTA